jgi:hypothetical protein
MRATPPALGTVPEFSRIDKVALENCIFASGAREGTQHLLGKDGDVPESSTV